MLASQITPALATTLLVCVWSTACAQTDGPSTVERREQLTFDGLPSVELRLHLPPEHLPHVDRYVSTIRGALRQFGDWFEPYPHAELTLVDRGWNDAPMEARESTALLVRTHWLVPEAGGTLEAALVRAVAEQFWNPPDALSPDAWLAEGLALYSAARALDEQFPNRHAYERRYFGELVPFVLRSVPIEGPSAQLFRFSATPDETRAALAFFTLERYLGWGTLQQALSAFAERRRSGHAGPEELFAILNATSGRDLRWFVDDAFRSSKVFDYGIESFASEPSGGESHYRTSVVVRRYGDAEFRGTNHPRVEPFHSSGPVEILVTFADGHGMREHWDGRDGSIHYEYESAVPATTATVDPDRVLPLDTNPTNNRRTLNHPDREAATWAVRWSVWMQDVLLSYAFFF